MIHTNLRDAFDTVKWDKIQAYMALTNWTWGSEVPTADDLKITVETLMSEMYRTERENTMVATGGFQINKWTMPTGIYYEIHFNIASRA